jgi:hypothetical protein
MLIIKKFVSVIYGFELLIKLLHIFIRNKTGIVSDINRAVWYIYNKISFVWKDKDTTFILSSYII